MCARSPIPRASHLLRGCARARAKQRCVRPCCPEQSRGGARGKPGEAVGLGRHRRAEHDAHCRRRGGAARSCAYACAQLRPRTRTRGGGLRPPPSPFSDACPRGACARVCGCSACARAFAHERMRAFARGGARARCATERARARRGVRPFELSAVYLLACRDGFRARQEEEGGEALAPRGGGKEGFRQGEDGAQDAEVGGQEGAPQGARGAGRRGRHRCHPCFACAGGRQEERGDRRRGRPPAQPALQCFAHRVRDLAQAP